MDLAEDWAIEALCAAAWPPLAERKIPGWRLTYAAGVSRRSNSANPIPGVSPELGGLVAACEEFYRGHGLPPRFRILSFLPPGLDQAIQDRGYEQEAEVCTLHAQDLPRAKVGPGAELAERATAEWVKGVTAAQARDQAASDTYARILAKLTIPAMFACSRNAQGEAVSFAYAAMRLGRICIESVATRSDHRGRGFARSAVGALMAWGHAQGAREAILQVQVENHAAIRLYRGLGFSRELYRYHYRTLWPDRSWA